MARARAVLPNAHAPYSDFRVAAAVLDEQGHVHLGVNVENASYGLTNCAERVAIGVAVCPEDGRQAAALAAHADVGLFAARSAVNAPAPRTVSVVDESA